MSEVTPPGAFAGIRWDAVAVVAALVAIVAGVVSHDGEPAADPQPNERVVWPDEVALGTPLLVERPAAKTAGGSGSGEVQLCGGEWVAADADGKPDPEALVRAGERGHRDAERITLERMLSSGDSRAVAAALRHRVFGNGLRPAAEPLDAERAAALASLVDMALVGNDAQVYAIARSACGLHAGAARCALLNAAQWARLDAENASAWLASAAEANLVGDRIAEDEALWRVARAPGFDSGFASTIGRVLAYAPDDDAHVAGTLSVVAQAINIEVLAQSSPAQLGLAKSCGQAAISTATRRERCDEAAAALVERADTMLHRAIGKDIGRRLGWPSERLDAIDAEQKALMAAMPAGDVESPTLDCAAVRRDLDWLRKVATFGETGALARAATTRTASSGR